MADYRRASSDASIQAYVAWANKRQRTQYTRGDGGKAWTVQDPSQKSTVKGAELAGHDGISRYGQQSDFAVLPMESDSNPHERNARMNTVNGWKHPIVPKDSNVNYEQLGSRPRLKLVAKPFNQQALVEAERVLAAGDLFGFNAENSGIAAPEAGPETEDRIEEDKELTSGKHTQLDGAGVVLESGHYAAGWNAREMDSMVRKAIVHPTIKAIPEGFEDEDADEHTREVTRATYAFKAVEKHKNAQDQTGGRKQLKGADGAATAKDADAAGRRVSRGVFDNLRGGIPPTANMRLG